MKKILIANRGEIAVRVMTTAKKMGITTVAVYSSADKFAPHVLLADEAYHIGDPAPSASYLDMDKIIDTAKKAGADAIHPGYGFLSENADFAQKVTDAGITFIGPSPEAMRIMGSKLAAKEAVSKYGTPMIPGSDGSITDPKLAAEIAKQIGFPVLIKASAGGGGKGMRIVWKEEDIESQMDRAISEAISAFGDGSVFVEKYVASPRHIEFQVLADQHGNYRHIFERECSVQRRHQKVIEEAPSTVLNEKTRKEMGEVAVNVARACDYVGAGTVEFLLDEDKNYYFLEMNTRLQVEHPVTEMITGLDLVEEQIHIARGEKIKWAQEDISIRGHSLELRIYAEDPSENFMPGTGWLSAFELPDLTGVRLDAGYQSGMDVPVYYDPLLGKLISYGADREGAINIMLNALKNFKIIGVPSTVGFGAFVFSHPAFISGNFDTHFVENYFTTEQIETLRQGEYSELAAQLGLQIYLTEKKQLRIP
jgi:propionyl-CoA carboxylase alpha chain